MSRKVLGILLRSRRESDDNRSTENDARNFFAELSDEIEKLRFRQPAVHRLRERDRSCAGSAYRDISRFSVRCATIATSSSEN